jgi:hypothetical protein
MGGGGGQASHLDKRRTIEPAKAVTGVTKLLVLEEKKKIEATQAPHE